jgi:hypothetical protein
MIMKEQLFIMQAIKNNNMITININTVKNILKLAILATLTYLTFSIMNNHAVPYINSITEDTTTSSPIPVYPFLK